MSEIVQMSHDVLRKHGRTFWLAGQFLPDDRRDDAAITYAFCRTVDDIADASAASPAEIAAELDRVADEIRGLAEPRPVVAAYLDVCRRLDIPRSAALELIEGCRQDTERVRIESNAELLRYAYRVAGTVGIMMCGILGVRDYSRAVSHAIDLGVGMQLTNISRDVLADAEMDRIYLPELQPRNDEQALATLERQPEHVASVTRDTLELAEQFYRSAIDGLQYIPVRSRIAIAIAALAYRAIGLKVKARGYVYNAPRAIVPAVVKMWWVMRGFMLALAPPKTPRHNGELHTELADLKPSNRAAI